MLPAMTAPVPTRWYRQPYVWLVISIPGSAVLFGIFMLVVSIRTYDGLVVDDYYKRGLEINRVLDRDRAAAEQGLRAELRLEASGIALMLDAHSTFAMPASLALGFYHATRGGMDRTLTLRRDASGIYRANFPPLAAGAWNVQAEDGDWRLLGRMVSGQRAPLQLTPGAGTLATGD